MSPDVVMEALEAAMVAAMPEREVQRGLVLDPANLSSDVLMAGQICIVAQGGGGFWNYQGREGDGGDLDVTVVGFVQVAEREGPVAVERAEIALQQDVISFCQSIGHGDEVLSAVVPVSWQLSGQLEHPFGWMVMKLKVRWL